MQYSDLTEIDRIGDVFFRSLGFVKALAGLFTLHKQLGLVVMPIQDNEPALQ